MWNMLNSGEQVQILYKNIKHIYIYHAQCVQSHTASLA